ncbi:cytidine deaminase-like protein, partial [Clavulina sp. PMI_390]
LPFTFLPLRPASAEDQETEEKFETIQCWAADVSDIRQIKALIDWAEKRFQKPEAISHLRSIRKTTSSTGPPQVSLILEPTALDDELAPTDLPESLSSPYHVNVPTFPARTKEQLKHKNKLWPCAYMPKQPGAAETYVWTEAEVDWIRGSMQSVIREAEAAMSAGEFGIASYVGKFGSSETFLARDTRHSTRHPLKHSVMNVIRTVADSVVSSASSSPDPTLARTSSIVDYLLTGLTLFTTHEPCIMCSMALVHSRVARVFILHGMPRTGGCGGCTAVTGLNGVNHRYDVYQWNSDSSSIAGAGNVIIEDSVDA